MFCGNRIRIDQRSQWLTRYARVLSLPKMFSLPSQHYSYSEYLIPVDTPVPQVSTKFYAYVQYDSITVPRIKTYVVRASRITCTAVRAITPAECAVVCSYRRCYCCCLHMKPFFLPNDISSSTPSVLVDYQVPGMNKCVGYIVSSLVFRFDVLAYFIGFFECLIIRSAYLSVEWTQLKVVLAYSGGLDTSVILKWLSSQGFEVIW